MSVPKTLLLCFLAVAVLVSAAPSTNAAEPSDQREITASIKVQISGAHDRVEIVPTPDGGYHYVITMLNGEQQELTPAEFTERVHRQERSQGTLERIFNISGPAGMIWVGLGFLGQVLFAGRMIVQWLTSERQHRSVVPPVFWWMSLAGASLLGIYFIWRRDLVGVLGQSSGWIIYLRNIWLIYRPARTQVTPDQHPPLSDTDHPTDAVPMRSDR